MKRKSISSKDVAREAGVSQATVSYVLNNNPDVKIKPETRQSVMDAAKKLNYHANYIARNMRLRKSSSIGVVTNKDMSSYIFMRTLEGIKDSLIERNYSITICFGSHEEIGDAEYIKYYYSNLIDGLIFVFTSLSDEEKQYLEDNGIPYVMINAHTVKESHFQIKTNIDNAIYEAVSHLHSKSIEKIGYIGATAGVDGAVRYDSYMAAMEKSALAVDKKYIYTTGAIESSLDDEIASLLNQSELPQALICDSVNAGFYTQRYLNRLGIRVPEDISLIMIGTSIFSKRSYPAISAVEAPLYSMGRRGCELLFDVMENDVGKAEDVIVLEWCFNKRESC